MEQYPKQVTVEVYNATKQQGSTFELEVNFNQKIFLLLSQDTPLSKTQEEEIDKVVFCEVEKYIQKLQEILNFSEDDIFEVEYYFSQLH